MLSRQRPGLRLWFAVISGRQRGLFAAIGRLLLWLASLLYRLAVGLRNRLFDLGLLRHDRVDRAVVCVGNLVVGGSGKTPMVELLARSLSQQGRKVVVLSRGYGARDGNLNDEALCLAERLPDVPHLQHKDRTAAARHAIAKLAADCLLLDDGFQHRRLGRDVDIVLLDATCPFGYGHVLPRGLLREPASALQRAHLVVITRANHVEADAVASIERQIASANPDLPILLADEVVTHVSSLDGEDRIGLSSLAGRKVLGFCGIGNPAGFEACLMGQGADLVEFVVFDDHHHYDGADAQWLVTRASEVNADVLVTTHKDAVKLSDAFFADTSLWVLHVSLELRLGNDALVTALSALLPPLEAP